MPSSDELKVFIEKLAAGTATDEEIEAIRQACEGSDKITVQVAKYINNVTEAQNSQFGDTRSVKPPAYRLSQNADTEAIQPAKLKQNQLSVDELVQKVRLRFHDDIQRLHSTMSLLGVDHWVGLGELFVDVNILEEVSSSRKSELNDLWQDFSNGVEKYSSYLSLDRIGLGKQQKRMPGLTVLAKNTDLMVLGKPGSGKTTYLQHIVTECNEGRLQPHRIPVLIKLREFVDDGHSFEYSLERYLTQQWRLSNAETELVLSQGKALILLDGLDEVTGTDGRVISKQIKQFARTYPQNQLIVTCRTQSQESRFERFDYVEVADFNEAQVNAFAEHWFQAVCSNAEEGQAKAKQFLDKLYLEENKTIRELAITPILLSLTCAVFQVQGKFYSKRSKLYEEGLELLLEKWDKSREIERDEIYRDLSVERKQELLSYLAVKKFEQQQYVLFEQEEIEGYIAEFLKISRRDSRVVLRAIEAQHGLLIERAQKVWSFSHLTFQEYFVAKWFCDQTDWEELVSNITKTRWREVFLLTSGILPNADLLLELTKSQIDRLFVGDNKLQQFLEWVAQKAKSVRGSYKPVSIRAFYFEITFTLVIAPKKASDGTLVDITEDGGLILFLEGAFSLNLSRACKNGIQKAGDGNPQLSLDYALVYALVLSVAFTRNYIYHVRLHYELYKGLNNWMNRAFKSAKDIHIKQLILQLRNQLILQFQAQLPVQESQASISSQENDENNESIWKAKCQAWADQLRTMMVEYCNVGHDWQLSDKQNQRLQQYYYASVTLVQCLNSGCEINDNVREKIEQTLLLPIAEIEKRFP
ncbi:MAG: NACHT domain-containing protein [Brasilonema octagenarum HA4186-MV1]|jgi:predicted NACHT family NTPase|nr:NACHT domain-containing protein [Brasilonema octagenarum HA4186-MV1]